MELNICHEKSTLLHQELTLHSTLTSMFKGEEIKYFHVCKLTAYNLLESDVKHYSMSQKKYDSNTLECLGGRVTQIRAPHFIKAKETDTSCNFFQSQP